MATPRYSSPAESASASRVSLASAGAGSSAGTVRAWRASTQDGRDGLVRNPYDISTVLAEPQASSGLLPALPTLPSASSYLPSQLSSLSTTFTSAGTLPRSATPGGKSVAQRRSQAPPIQVTELRKVQRTEFDAYLKEIGGEFERWQKESRLGRDGEVDLGDEGSVDERHEDGVGLGIGGEAESSRTPRLPPAPRPKKAEEVLPSLDEVPQIFFDSSFTLSNPRTFDLVTERIQLSPHPSPDPSKAPPRLASANSTPTASAGSAFDSSPGLGPHTLNDLAADQVLQEKLSHYTAVIESHLVREIGLRSSSFFAALSNLQSLHQQGEDALSKIAELQTALSATEGGVGGTAKHGLQILRAQARRRGLERIEESVRAVEEVWNAVEGVKELVEHGEWDGALDVSEQIEDAYYSSASSSNSDKTASPSALTTRNDSKASNRRPLNLTKLRALSSLPSKLSLLRAQIAKSLEGELTTVLEHEMDVAIVEHVKLANEGQRWKGKQKAVELATEANGRVLEDVAEEGGEEADGAGRQDSPEADARERAVERVRPVMRALIRSDGMDSAVTAWRESVLREIRALVREHLPTAETPTAEEEDQFAQAAIRSVSKQSIDLGTISEKSLSLAKKLRALPHPAFLALARETYRGLLACIEVVDLQARILLELWQVGRQEEQQRRSKRRKAHADAPSSESAPPASPTTLQVPGAEADAVQSPASPVNDASSVTTDDASALSTEISDVVHAVAELANVRFSKVIGVRTEVHAQLPLADFVEIFDLTWQFVVDCETVCQRMIVGLRGAMVSQAKTFLQTFHQRQITDNARVVEEEQWAAAEVPARVQEQIAVIVDSAMRDPVQLLLRQQSDATNGNAAADEPSEQVCEGDEGEAAAAGPAKQVDIEGRQFFAVSAGLTTIGVLVEYLKVLLNCPMLTTDAMSKIIEFMKVFNSRTCQVVLGAGAMRSAGLKNITAKHLALASQALSIMIALIPYIRECVRRHLNPKQAVMLTEFDKLKRDYQEHQYEIYAKLVAIMSDRLEVHSRTLSGINWEEPAPKADAPNAYMEGLVKEHITLHKVLSRFLQAQTVQQIMSQVFKALDTRLGELYGRVELRSQQAKDRMLLDVRYLREKLGDLSGLEGQGPAKELEALVNAKMLPKPPLSAPKPSLPPRTSSMAPAAASVPVSAPSDATDSPPSSTPHLPNASTSASASAASLAHPDTRSPRASLDGTATPASSVPNPPSPAPVPAVLPLSPKPAAPAPYVSKKKKSLAERLAESIGRKATPSPATPASDASATAAPAAPRQSSESAAPDAQPSSDSHDAPPVPQRFSTEGDIGVDTPSIERQLELENVEVPLATPAKEELEDVVKAVEKELKEEKPEEVAEGTVKETKPDEAKLEEAEPEEAEAEGAASTLDAEASTDSIATPEPVEVEPALEESAVAVEEVVEATALPASPAPLSLDLVGTGSSAATPNTSTDQPDVPTGDAVEEAPVLPAPSAPESSADGNEEARELETTSSPQDVDVSAEPSEAHVTAPEVPIIAPAATNIVDEPAPAEPLASDADGTLSAPPPTIAEPSALSLNKTQPEQAAVEAVSSNEPVAVSQSPADTPTVPAVDHAPQAPSSNSPVPSITTPPPIPTPTKKKSLKERLEEAARRRSSTGSLVDVTSPPASIKSPPPTQQSFPPKVANGSSEDTANGLQEEESDARQDPIAVADDVNQKESGASGQSAAHSMPPKKAEDGSQQSISSFFSRAPVPQKRESVLVLDSSDEDEEVKKQAGRGGKATQGVKRVKTEHDSRDSQLQPIAATSKLPTTATSPPRDPQLPSSQRLRQFAYSRPDSSAPKSPSRPSSADQSRHDAFVKKLSLGPNLLQRRTSYLQKEHYLAARDDNSDGEGSPAGGLGSPGIMAEDFEEEAESDSSSSSTPVRAKDKGKGKATESEDKPSGLAKFAAKGTKAGGKSSSEGKKVKYTPFEQQVLALRKAHPGVLLVIEVGYKFRFFDEDAQVASRILNIACFPSQHMLTASIPTHRLDVHVKRLLNAGYKVGVVRQQETAALKKASDNRSAPFTRALSALYTSATYVDELGVDPLTTTGSTATIMCVVEDKLGKAPDAKVKIGMVAVVPSTGQVVYDELEDGLMRSELETRMLHLQPSELLLQKELSSKTESMVQHLVGQHNAGTADFRSRIDRISKRPSASQATTQISDYYASVKKREKGKEKASNGEALRKEPSEIVLSSGDEGEGANTEISRAALNGTSAALPDLPKLVLIALASLISHLKPFNLDNVFSHASSLTPFASRASMNLNGNTVANLELLRNNTDFKEHGSLIACIDKCKTAMGKRLLRKWLTKPLLSKELVEERLDAIFDIHRLSASLTLSKLRDLLRHLPDLERGLSRIHFGRATPNELLRVLEAFRRIGDVFVEVDSPDEDNAEARDDGPIRTGAGGGLRSTLLKSVVKELPKVKQTADELLAEVDGKRARDNDKEELFVNEDKYPDLKKCKAGLARTLDDMQDELKSARKVLRKPALQFTKVAQEEYLFEVKIAEAKTIVPVDWIRINSTKQAYRYRSPKLHKMVTETLEQWKEKVAAAAKAAFHGFLQEVSSHYELFRTIIASAATADCLFGLALVALSNNWVRPTIVDEPGYIDFVDGRHPIIEEVSPEPFVSNSVKFGGGERRQMVLTGLNMGGKSSLSRMIALIALLAQIGSFVPAESCTTSLFDGIYTRMGANDDVARGRSTFLVELTETSEILHLATPRSLLILDELGRGTSTNDGQAIAAAVLEYIVRSKRSTCVFVTHYPSLALVAQRFPESVSVNHMACIETPREDGHADVTFLYRLADGLASASHGLNVARLADLPQRVLDTAKAKGLELMKETEERTAKRKAGRLAEILGRVARLARADEGMGVDDGGPSASQGSVTNATSQGSVGTRRNRLLELCEAALVK
ncbi:hypothetical protein JCM10296v2_001688 [Rhodotorula toruloides]